MVPGIRAAAASAALALVALAVSDTCRAQEVLAYDEKRPEIDYDAFWASVPQFKELGNEALEGARQINEAMDKLAATEKDEATSKQARAATRELLLRYRDNKRKVARLADLVLKRKGTPEPDLEIMKRLRQTELIGITWDKTKFIDCLRDLAEALQVDFVIHPDVLKFNTVEITFPRTAADGILRTITTGFDCDYFVHDGEIIVIKTFKMNDRRMKAFLDRHPDWKYWRPKEVKEVEDDL